MKKNMSGIDRIIRVLIALVLVYLVYTGSLSIDTWQGILASIIAVVFLATALMSSCPLYSLFGMSTCPIKD